MKYDPPHLLHVPLDWSHPAPRFVHPDSEPDHPVYVYSRDEQFEILKAYGRVYVRTHFTDTYSGTLQRIVTEQGRKAIKIHFIREDFLSC